MPLTNFGSPYTISQKLVPPIFSVEYYKRLRNSLPEITIDVAPMMNLKNPIALEMVWELDQESGGAFQVGNALK